MEGVCFWKNKKEEEVDDQVYEERKERKIKVDYIYIFG